MSNARGAVEYDPPLFETRTLFVVEYSLFDQAGASKYESHA